jgi:hypothetical protein
MRNLLNHSLIVLFAALLLAPGAQAQPGPGAGWRASQGNTPGFTLMTQQERSEHQNRMRSMKTYDECTAYVGDHRAQMVARAQEKGITLQPPGSPCEMMKSRGLIQ